MIGRDNFGQTLEAARKKDFEFIEEMVEPPAFAGAIRLSHAHNEMAGRRRLSLFQPLPAFAFLNPGRWRP